MGYTSLSYCRLRKGGSTMPWQEVSVVFLRTEFLTFAQREGANISELCRRFGISRKTGYKWLKRSKTHGMSALEDRSRRPRRMPLRTSKEVEDQDPTAPRCPPCVGCAEAPSSVAGPRGTGPPRAQHHHRDPPTPRTSGSCRVKAAPGLAALRAPDTECAVADGFQGTFSAAPRPMPSANGAG